MSDLILHTRRLTTEFKGVTAVAQVDLNVVWGSIHALIGPNEAEKTVCFDLLTKFLEPTAGTIHFNGRDITRERPAQIARRGSIRSFQISAVSPPWVEGHQRKRATGKLAWLRHGPIQFARLRSFDRAGWTCGFAQNVGARICDTDRCPSSSRAVILMTLIGGLGTLSGPRIGSAAVVLLENKIGEFDVGLATLTGIGWSRTLGE